MQGVVGELRSRLEEKGYQSRIVSVGPLRDVKKAIEGNRSRGLLDEEFYRERLTFFSFKPPDLLPRAISLIVVAVPRPQTGATFTMRGESVQVPLPPPYAGYRETNRRLEDLLSTVLNPEGYSVAQAALPLKYIAVCSGLGAYGRNNILRPWHGELSSLVAFYADFPCLEDS